MSLAHKNSLLMLSLIIVIYHTTGLTSPCDWIRWLAVITSNISPKHYKVDSTIGSDNDGMVVDTPVILSWIAELPLQWRHKWSDGVSNHQPHECLLIRLFRRSSKKTSELRVTGLCVGNSPVTGEFPAQMASNAEIVSIWWRHHIVYLVYR